MNRPATPEPEVECRQCHERFPAELGRLFAMTKWGKAGEEFICPSCLTHRPQIP